MIEDRAKLKVQDLNLSFGGVRALSDVSIEVRGGEILAIIGPNGAGKTCLLNCISGFYAPDKGQIFFEGENITDMSSHKRAHIGLARTFQNVGLYLGMRVVDNIVAGRQAMMKAGVVSQALYFGRAHREEMEARRIAEDIIDFLEIEAWRNKAVATIPYGLRKRVELGRALAMEPKVLLLDEPVAGMNLEEKEDLARFILDIYEERVNTIVLVEHDMSVVMDISHRVIVLDLGKVIADGSPEQISINPKVVEAYLGALEEHG